MDEDFMGYEYRNTKCPTCGEWFTHMELDGNNPWCARCQNEHDHEDLKELD